MKQRNLKILVPVNFHSILKMEATLKSQPMTKFMSDLAVDIEKQNGSIKDYFRKVKKDEKKDKRFSLNF